MSVSINFRPEAERDIEEGAKWYEQQRTGLGYDFLQEVEKTAHMVSENVMEFEKVHKNLRRAVIKRFPFNLFYLYEKQTVIVVAVIHGSRHPKKWQYRIS